MKSSMTASMAHEAMLEDGHDKSKIKHECEIDRCAVDIIDPQILKYFQLNSNYEEGPANFQNNFQDRIDRLRMYLENGPSKYANIGTRVLVDWCRVKPSQDSEDDFPLRIVALLRDPETSTKDPNEMRDTPDYTKEFYLQEFQETRFSFEKVGSEIAIPKPYATQRLKTNRRYNHNPMNSSIVTFNEPSHLEGNPGYKRYGESFIYDYNSRKCKKLSLNIRDLKSHLNYKPAGEDLFKDFVDNSNAWVQGRCMMPVYDKILIFLNDTRNKKQIWATILTMGDGNNYTIDYEPQPIHFQEQITQIKNLQDLSIIDSDKIMIIVQATCTNPHLSATPNKDYYFPLFLKMKFNKTETNYVQLTPFTCTLPDSVNNYKEQGARRIQIKIPRGYGSDVMIDAFPYLTFGIVNASVYGFNKFAYYWTLTDKKTFYYRFCKMHYNPKATKYELIPSDVVDMKFPSKYIFNHDEDETKSLYKENFLKTTMDGETINSMSDKIPCVKFQKEENSNFLFLQYPYNQQDINKIDLADGDITTACGNVHVVVDKSKRSYGIYLNEKEKGFIICHSRKVDHKIYDVKLTEDGTMYLLQELTKEYYQQGVPSDTDESKSDYYAITKCNKLDFDNRQQYFFKIPESTNKWKPKLAQTQCKQIMGESLTATDKNILDLENNENYTSDLAVYLQSFSMANEDNKFYFFSNFGQIYETTIDPKVNHCKAKKILDINKRIHKVLISPSKKFAIIQHHPWMGPWYSPSKNENHLVRFAGSDTEQVQVNTQSSVFDEDFPVFQKFDDWHKFGIYFSKVNDIIFCYNHGFIFEVNLEDITRLEDVKPKFKKIKLEKENNSSKASEDDEDDEGDAYEGQLTFLEHYNKDIDIVKYSKAMYLSHIGKVEDFVDSKGNRRIFMISILYLEKELWLFDLTNDNFQTNYVCIRGYDMEYQQQRVSIVSTKDGRICLQSDDRFIFDVSATAMFRDKEPEHSFYQSVYSLEFLHMKDGTHNIVTKYLTFDEQYPVKGITDIQFLQTNLAKLDDSQLCPMQKVKALPPLNIFAFLSEMTLSTKLSDWKAQLKEVNDMSSLLDPLSRFDRENIIHHVVHKTDFLEALTEFVATSESMRVFENMEGISPLDVVIATEDVSGVQEVLNLVMEKQSNQITKNLLNDRVTNIMMLGVDMREFFDSNLVIDELRLDFLPSQGNKFTQVMYVDKDFIEKTCSMEEGGIEFDSEFFIQSGLYDLNADLSDQKEKSVNYQQMTIPELINREFLEALLEVDKIKYYDTDFLKYFKEVEWNLHYADFQKDKNLHYLVGICMLINVYFINAYEAVTSSDGTSSTYPNDIAARCTFESAFCYEFSGGRQNIFLIAIKAVILIIFLVTIMEEFKQMMGVGYQRYFKMQENFFDLGMIIFFLVSLYNDSAEVCNNWCIIYYQPTLIFIFVVLIKHLRLESKLAFILEMLIMTIFEMTWFLFTFWLLLVLFMFLFFIQGLYLTDDMGVGYSNIGVVAAFLVTVQEAFGNFGTVAVYESSDDTVMTQVLSYEYNTFWVLMVFIMLIIYTNFLIASVSDTYENVTESQDSTFSKIQLQQLVTKMIIEENQAKEGEFKKKENMIIKSCEVHKEGVDQWAGYVSEVKRIVTGEINQIARNQHTLQSINRKQTHMILNYMARTSREYNKQMEANSKSIDKILHKLQDRE